MEIGLLDGKLAVITDSDGLICAVVRDEDDDTYLMNLCELAELDPSVWDREPILDDPVLRDALGLPLEVERRDLILSSRPKGLARAMGETVVSWSMARLRNFLSRS